MKNNTLKVKVYQLDNKNHYLLDLMMNDKYNSHRYYLVDKNEKTMYCNKIKDIDYFIDYIDQNNIHFRELDRLETYRLLLSLIESFNYNNNKVTNTIKDYVDSKYIYNNYSLLHNIDYELLDEYNKELELLADENDGKFKKK